ncbi:adenylyl-sulfate kinase [Bacillus infantis]|uniref:adenylyl-sulfate kinase n=1 Tax=Bacillus infantis TaxID=324767 RepID=UPI003CEF1F2A
MQVKEIYWHDFQVTKKDRQALHGHKSMILWFTGLSGSGKSTIANALEARLHKEGYSTFLLDGDNTRFGLNKDLGFSEKDRKENIRRIGEVCRLMAHAGLIVLASFISPYKADRSLVRSLAEEGEFIEVYVDCPLEVCEARDPKGLYQKAKKGAIHSFTGITAPYEPPDAPEIIIRSDLEGINESVQKILCYLKEKSNL